MRKIKNVLLLLFYITSVLSCNTKKDELEGVYIGNFNDFDTIKLYKNSTYERIIFDKNKTKIFSNSSTWKVANKNISLEDFLINENDLTTEHKYNKDDLINVNLPIKNNFGIIKLYTNFDLNYYYLKIDNPN